MMGENESNKDIAKILTYKEKQRKASVTAIKQAFPVMKEDILKKTKSLNQLRPRRSMSYLQKI